MSARITIPLIFDPQDELTMMKESLCRIIAGELQARAEQVEAAVRLLDEGNTVPFIARYRKEVTGGLDDTQLRNFGDPSGLSARAGRPTSGDPQIYRRAGQADQ